MNSSVRHHVRHTWQKTLISLANARCRPATAKELRRSAIVFSPHFDDETLGCGGTILKKIQTAARVTVVFMTDGSKSHRHRIGETELSEMRSAEARRAARRYSLPEPNVFYLGYEETRLADFADEAVDRCAAIIGSQAPEEIYVPYFFSGAPPDHAATNRIAIAALRATGRCAWVNEYPVWFWNHWPFCSLKAGSRSDLPRLLLDSVRRNIQLVGLFNSSVDVKEVLPTKREILAEYRSQMTRVDGDKRWLTLHDVSDGDWLACFFRSRELFRCRVMGSR